MKIWTVYFRSYWLYKNAFIWTKYVISSDIFDKINVDLFSICDDLLKYVMVIVLDWGAVDHGSGSSVRSKQQAVKLVFVASPLSMQYFRSNSKDGLARCQNNVSVWNDMSTHRLLFQWDSSIIYQNHHDISKNIAHSALNNNRSLTKIKYLLIRKTFISMIHVILKMMPYTFPSIA